MCQRQSGPKSWPPCTSPSCGAGMEWKGPFMFLVPPLPSSEEMGREQEAQSSRIQQHETRGQSRIPGSLPQLLAPPHPAASHLPISVMGTNHHQSLPRHPDLCFHFSLAPATTDSCLGSSDSCGWPPCLQVWFSCLRRTCLLPEGSPRPHHQGLSLNHFPVLF